MAHGTRNCDPGGQETLLKASAHAVLSYANKWMYTNIVSKGILLSL